MRTRIVPALYCGIAMYELHYRRWWWPIWSLSVTTTSLRDAQNIARDIRSRLVAP